MNVLSVNTSWAANSACRQSPARINDRMAQKMPYIFKKDVVTSGKSLKNSYEANISTQNRSTPDDDASATAVNSWIY
jgi:hypothetical protein